MIKRALVNFMSAACLSACIPGAAVAAEPKADEKAVVTVGSARFTVLTDRLIRMEYVPDGAFEDRATLTFVNRRLPVPDFTAKREGAGCVIDTGALRLTYRGGPFAAETLAVSGKGFDWRYGDADTGNLMGTTRTLDGVEDRATLDPLMEKGLLSRDGWTVVDDSVNHVFTPAEDHWGPWVSNRDGVTYTSGEITAGYGRKHAVSVPHSESRDLYFFGYGHDYKGCLGDYVKVAGRIPLPPRWAFGFWWSRYWLYTDREVRELVDTMRSLDIPLDVFVIDMEWHDTWHIVDRPDELDEFGQKYGWTGYTWNGRLFPDPQSTLDYLHSRGCKVTLNVHPASGIQPFESSFSAFAAAYGWRGTNAVPYRATDRKWCDAYFDTVLGPLEEQGVDFWWLDWQQWIQDKSVTGLSNTFWLNHVFDRHMAERRGGTERPFIYHRWGGLGSHRYQVGFSGDSRISWGMLEAMPYFTSTSGNVGYGYWGHDLGGHQNPAPGDGTNGELFTRWLQSGVFNPIFKIHSSKNPAVERRIWKYPEHFLILREAMNLRYRLAPYVYTAARQAYDTGVSLCRPMYYDSSECDAAYEVRNANMFGDDILAVTLAKPADAESGLTEVDVWLPEGAWYDVSHGELVVSPKGGKTFARSYAIDQNPWFVRGGAIVPMYPRSVRNLANPGTDELEFLVAPGAETGEGVVYEDDGVTPDYAANGHVTKIVRDGNRITISPRAGRYTLRFPLVAPFAKALVNGVEVPCAFDADDFAAVVVTPYVDGASETVVELVPSEGAAELNGLKREFRAANALTEDFKGACSLVHWALNLPDSWQSYWQTPAMLAAHPDRFAEFLKARKVWLKAFEADLDRLEGRGLGGDVVRRLRVFVSDVNSNPR